MLIGYGRVSTRGQKLDRQEDALISAGCTRIFMEKLSGKNADRPELIKCLDFARAGDTITVLELWRLGRNLQDLLSIVSNLRQQGIGLNPNENLDTTTPGGRLIFHVFAALAEFIREMIELLGVSRSTIYKYVPELKPALAPAPTQQYSLLSRRWSGADADADADRAGVDRTGQAGVPVLRATAEVQARPAAA